MTIGFDSTQNMNRNQLVRIRALGRNHRFILQYALIILVAATIFYFPTLLNLLGIAQIDPSDFFAPKLETPIDAIYFSIVSITTLGFGDIHPISQIMKLVVSLEVLLGIVTIGQALHSMAVKVEEEKRLPHRLAAYEDVRLLTCRLILYWQDIYIQSVPGKFPSNLEDLLSQDSITKMGMCLDLDAKPNVSPPRTWWDWLPSQLSELTKRAEKILERHVQILDPIAYRYIHRLLSHGMLSDMAKDFITAIRHSDRAERFPRPTNFGNYMIDNEESLQPLLALDKWCTEEYGRLKRSSDTEIQEPFEFPRIERALEKPASLISPEKLKAQYKKMEEHRESNKSNRPQILGN